MLPAVVRLHTTHPALWKDLRRAGAAPDAMEEEDEGREQKV